MDHRDSLDHHPTSLEADLVGADAALVRLDLGTFSATKEGEEDKRSPSEFPDPKTIARNAGLFAVACSREEQ